MVLFDRFPVVTWVFFMSVFCAAVPLALAAPVPSTKPLQGLKQSGFVEGVDLPRSKPKSGISAPSPKRHRPETPKEACSISNVTLKDLEPVAGALNGERMDDAACGIDDPIMLKSIETEEGTVKFAVPVTISCKFAKVVVRWLRKDVLPIAVDGFGSTISTIYSGPGYQCRRRNNLPDGKLSEHALGKALDISQFQLSNGTKISVEDDWGAHSEGSRFLERIHSSACKRFTTVLGPEADASHKSHIHLDTGCHGQDCTYVICQ